MDYDLWVRISKVAWIQYYPHTWANFRLHQDGKSITADDRCWPEMIRVHQREGGSWLSWLVFKAKLRPLLFAWMPLKFRIWVRKNFI